MLDYAALEFWLILAQCVVGLVGGLVARAIRDLRRDIAAAREEADSRLDAVEARVLKCEELAGHDVIKRLGSLERLVGALASTEQIARIHARIDEGRDDHARLSTEIGEVKGMMSALSTQMGIIQQHLLEK